MKLALLHRRLTVLMSLAALVAFAGGAGFEPVSASLGTLALLVALFWQPSPELSRRLERVWLPLAGLLVARALLHFFVLGGDVVIPVVDLLLLLMCAEALRSLDAPNDVRLYALSFALLLASTAYRPGFLFALAFVAYVALGTVALMVGHMRRQAERFGLREITLDRRFLLITTALSGVTLVVSLAVFVAFPRASRGWTGRGETPATSVAGFSDQVSLAEHGARIYSNPRIVLRVEFPGGRPANVQGLHWRGRSYDRFDGVRWTRSRGIRPSSGPTRWYRQWSDSTVVQKIYAAPLDVRALFAIHPVLDIEAESGIHPLFDNVGDFFYWGSATPVYTATSVAGRPPVEELRDAERGFMPDPEHYLQLPRLPDRIHELADSLTTGAETRYDRAVAVERWLRTFEYTRDLPESAAAATLEHFLFERRAGHCEYFSSAMVVLLRSQGIHARNVNGFLGGQWSGMGDYLAVTQNEAHSWVEVWFPDYGWVTFDPTPAGAGGSTASQVWFWPGRFMFDAFQHRWSKWVLDFDPESQAGLLERLTGGARSAVSTTREGAEEAADSSLLWLASVLVVVGLGGYMAFRRRSPHPAESRIYLKLVDACRRADLVSHGQVTPSGVVTALEERGHPAAAPARELVDRYVRLRFAGEEPAAGTERVMHEALRKARELIRKTSKMRKTAEMKSGRST